jgi:hypothetical protein
MKTKPITPRSTHRFCTPRAAAIAALACTTLISACGSSSKKPPAAARHLNTTRVAISIEQSILKQRHRHAKVSCPAVVLQEAGRNFDCVASMSKGVKTTFAVTQGNNGNVTYQGL